MESKNIIVRLIKRATVMRGCGRVVRYSFETETESNAHFCET